MESLRRGGIILYPTDTVWGIGCDATNRQAIEKIIALKRSEGKAGLITLMESADMAVRYCNGAPDVAWQLMEMADKPLTLILPGGSGVAPELLGPEGTIAVRVPNHDFCHRLLQKFRRPLVSTSANISGEATPLKFGDISKEIIEGVDLVIDPAAEGNPTRKPSAIIELGRGGEIKIVRE